jgi:hypothetical protein
MVVAISGVADPMQTILDVPITSPPIEKLTRIGVVTRDARDGALSLDGNWRALLTPLPVPIRGEREIGMGFRRFASGPFTFHIEDFVAS